MTWTFTRAPEFQGSTMFSYGVSDGEAVTPRSMSLMVQEVNDPPVAVDDVAPGSLEAGQSVVITAAQLLENDYDVDGYPGQLTVVSVEVASGEGTLVPGANGTWTFTPDEDFHGEASLTYTIEDMDGAQSTATAMIHVHESNDPPVVTMPVQLALPEDGVLTITEEQLLVNASDADGDALHVENVTYAGADGTLEDNGDDTWTFTPAEDFSGTVNLSYSVSDGTEEVYAAANVMVTPENDAAVIYGDLDGAVAELGNAYSADGGVGPTMIEGSLTAADVDSPATFIVQTNVPVDHGLFSITAGGQWTYMLDNGDPAVDGLGLGDHLEFSIPVATADGTAVPVGIRIDGTNDAPMVSSSGVRTMDEGTTLTLSAADFLANATDVDLSLIHI